MVRTSAAVALLVILLAGCSSDGSALLATTRLIFASRGTLPTSQLNPKYRYLRITLLSNATLLALGYIEDEDGASTEIWYSSSGEMLRLRNGRFAGAIGLPTEWRRVVIPPMPEWGVIARRTEATHWTRIRDVMPGYRYGVRDHLTLRLAAPPARSALQGLDPKTLTWFEERGAQAGGNPNDAQLPVARYALATVDGATAVVYGEQCLAPDYCLTWQRWPAVQKSQSAK